jgi:hypothetical protein
LIACISELLGSTPNLSKHSPNNLKNETSKIFETGEPFGHGIISRTIMH